jgi:hypothetical protein
MVISGKRLMSVKLTIGTTRLNVTPKIGIGTSCESRVNNPKSEHITPALFITPSKFLSHFIPSMYIFGGNDINQGQLNNLWRFNLSAIGDCKSTSGIKDHMIWESVQTSGDKKPGKLSILLTLI